MSDNFFINKYKKNIDHNILNEKNSSAQNSLATGDTVKKEPKKFVFKKLEEVIDKEKSQQQSANTNNNGILSKKKLAALLLILSDSSKSAKILSSFTESEIVKIAGEILSIKDISQQELKEVEKNFGALNIADLSQYRGGKEFLRTLLQNAFGITKGSELFINAIEQNDDKSFSFLKAMPPDKISEMLKDESDLIISFILSSVDSKLASKILSLMPKDKLSGIIKRMSDKIEINSDALDIIAKKIKEKAKAYIMNDNTVAFSGKQKLIDILKHSDPNDSTALIDEIEQENPDLAEEIKEKIFTFNDVPHIKKKDLEYALKLYPDNEIAFILKGATDEMKTIFFTCMTKRRKELIANEIKYLGEVRKSDVDAHRKEFITFLKELEQSGKISFNKDDEIYVS